MCTKAIKGTVPLFFFSKVYTGRLTTPHVWVVVKCWDMQRSKCQVLHEVELPAFYSSRCILVLPSCTALTTSNLQQIIPVPAELHPC